MEIALVGLQFAGKSTVFDLMAAAVGAAGPHGTGSRRLTVELPDTRLDKLAAVLEPEKVTQATLSLLDPAQSGVDEGRGRAVERDPLSDLRTCDGLIGVIRAFQSPLAPHPAGSVDPLRDMRGLLSELILADLVVVDARVEKIQRLAKVGKKPENPNEAGVLERCKSALESESPLKALNLGPDEKKLLSGFSLMTLKPMLAVLNVGERNPADSKEVPDRGEISARFTSEFPDTSTVAVCAPLELELAGLSMDEAGEFMQAEGIERLGGELILEALPTACGRITFYTVVRGEARAWLIPKGSTAAQAAGAVHTDMEKGFIKAETIGWRDLVQCGSLAASRERGLLRLEGREYVVRDGDVMTIKFSP
jgi:GTP-binding protein YchF